ncbi:hypothetical protein [Alteromonas sp. a30]|uniref:hypothetical protein n=1 Tax=Alteromonas sp. a30 TaxID=2730917 RepID=UPI002280861D|nr:hypothetical protein [Alteromonas sp. a30]MCY7296270.1 hypothetical protein [Alteromonas sp. a30]
MRNTLKNLALTSALLMTTQAFATDLVCDVYLKPGAGGNTLGNGTAHCDGFDFSFSNSTTGRFYLKNISKPIQQVIWQGGASSCSGGTQCTVTLPAYSPKTATAIVLYDDGTYETTNLSRMYYESGF